MAVVGKWENDWSEQADAQSRSEVSRLLPIHCHNWICLSNATLECTPPVKRFPSKTANENNFLSTQSLTFIITVNQWTFLKLTIAIKKLNSTSTTKTKTNKYNRRLRCTWRTLLKLKNTKKTWSTKYQRTNIQPIKTKTIKYTRRLRYIRSTWITLIKLANTKNWTWRNTKQTWALLKLTNTKKKLNSNSMT